MSPGSAGLAAIALLLVPVTTARPCPLPKNVLVTQSARFRLGDELVSATAMSVPVPDDWGDPNVRFLVRDTHCRTMFDKTEGGLEARFDRQLIDGMPLLDFIVMQPAGDGIVYVHELLIRHGGTLGDVLPRPVQHTGKDGFFLGRLVGGGEGIVTWDADPDVGGGEADAHPYIVTTWRWRNGRFQAPTSYETTRRYLPSDTEVPRSDVVARAMGLPYRDQTWKPPFGNEDRLIDRLNRLDERLLEPDHD